MMMPCDACVFRVAPANLVVLLCFVLAACAPLPDIAAATQTAPGPAPVLVPLDGILAQADAVGTGAAAIGPMAARADSLRARADRLRRQ
ncbi:MAG: hypothetical protein ACK4GC_06065 [Paracoccaceae bacterium]